MKRPGRTRLKDNNNDDEHEAYTQTKDDYPVDVNEGEEEEKEQKQEYETESDCEQPIDDDPKPALDLSGSDSVDRTRLKTPISLSSALCPSPASRKDVPFLLIFVPRAVSLAMTGASLNGIESS